MNQTSPDYREAARGQTFFARMAELRGDKKAAEAHRALAGVYTRQELKKAVRR